MQNVVTMQQVHGNNVVLVDSKNIGTTVPDCDALITSDPNLTLCVRVADCLAISLIDKKSRATGLIHAGWRGLANGIIGKSIEAMVREFGLDVKNLKVMIGPHICVKHYQVKNDVSSKFEDYPEAIVNDNGSIFLDLAKIAQSQLIKLGIKNENIDIDLRCTFEDSNLYSYRRNKTIERNLITLNI